MSPQVARCIPIIFWPSELRIFVSWAAIALLVLTCASCGDGRWDVAEDSSSAEQPQLSPAKPKVPEPALDKNLDTPLRTDTASADSAAEFINLPDSMSASAAEENYDFSAAETGGSGTDDTALHSDESLPEAEVVNYAYDELNLKRERLLEARVQKVIRPNYINTRDSVLEAIEARMRLHAAEVPGQMVVEKWYSPVNYRGYKFNRKKLILYGIARETPVDVIYYLDQYYLSANNQLFVLSETVENRRYEMSRDSILKQHLITYVN